MTGDDLIAMGLAQGPRFKTILDAVREGQLEGKLRTPDEVRAFVRDGEWGIM